MSNSTFKLQLLVRSELALMKITANRTAAKSGYFLVAIIFVLMGLGMLNYAAYLALAETMSPSVAALIVASVNAAIAVIATILGRSSHRSEGEEQMAKEIRDMAYAELGNDVEDVKQRIDSLADEVKAVRKGVSSALGIIKLLGSLIANAKKSDSKRPSSA